MRAQRIIQANLWKLNQRFEGLRFSATTCRANAALPRLRPTCLGPWRRGIPKAGASRCRSMTSRGAIEYPDVVRFEIEEQDLASYRRAADFLNIQQRGHRLGPARVRNFRRAGRQPLVGAAARIESAGRHHAPHRSPQAERRPASRDAGIDRALHPAGGHDGAGTADLAGGLPGAAGQDRSHPARYSRRTIRRSGLLQGPVRRGRKEGVADVRAAFAEQGD